MAARALKRLYDTSLEPLRGDAMIVTRREIGTGSSDVELKQMDRSRLVPIAQQHTCTLHVDVLRLIVPKGFKPSVKTQYAVSG